MKTTNKKRGFTIVELVIVVAVIAILAAVLIPTFTGIVNKSRESADESAVRNMNLILQAEDDNKPTTIAEVEALLAANGYSLKGYTPLSTNYSFIWDCACNRIILYSVADDAVVYPEDYKGNRNDWRMLNTAEAYQAPALADAAASLASIAAKGGVVKLPGGDLALPTVELSDGNLSCTVNVKKDTFVELGGTTITVAGDTVGDGVFCVTKGTLTLNGDGIVNANNDSGYDMAVWANGGDVVINGGTYTNTGCGADVQYDLIYVKNGSKVTINGGSFKCQTPKWTLNINNVHNLPGTIVVNGGEFFEFNPATDAEDDGVIVNGTVKTETRDDGTWYIVVPN